MLDRASICVRAGRGGNGSMSFRREKYVPKGGPDGGDGAPGGDVVLVATRQLHDLSHFRHKHHFRAQDGGQGRGANKRGADGPELLVQGPVGTEVLAAEGEVLGDLVHEGQRLRVAR
ncbi:MAG: GTPase ObgE, partial [Actinomycetes bacterium]